MKVTIKGIIKESTDNRQRYYSKVSKVIRPPYFVDLQSLGVPEDEWVEVFKTLYKDNTKITYCDGCITDITIGLNGTVRASTGYDYATGLGSPNCSQLILGLDTY